MNTKLLLLNSEFGHIRIVLQGLSLYFTLPWCIQSSLRFNLLLYREEQHLVETAYLYVRKCLSAHAIILTVGFPYVFNIGGDQNNCHSR